MLKILLYTHVENTYVIPLMWAFGILMMAALVILIVVQRRTGVKLKQELSELDKMRQGNIEYEFILKAMKLATWHMNPKTRTITFDADMRGGNDNYFAAPETSIDLLPDLLVKSDAQRVMASLEELFTGTKSFYHERYQAKLGSTGLTYWEESFATISARDEDGRPTKIVGASMRIDEQKKMEAALISARNKAEESDRLKTAFLANMGHEIRTPLNAIVGFADLLPMVQNDEDRNQIISEIQMNNSKLLRIIDGLVSMSKIEAEAKSLVKAQVDVLPILLRIVDTHAPTVDSMTVRIITEFPYSELMMNTDVDKLTTIIDNLMQNAVKFTERGLITLGFDLSGGEYVRFWVRDTGKGISADDQKRIFERFFKVDEFVPGTGLGLSVAKAHAESLGGTIGVESTLGSGSTFWVNIPLM